MQVGGVVRTGREDIPFLVVDAQGNALPEVEVWVRDLMRGDARPKTCRSYCYALLTWYRVLWTLGRPWDRATENDTAVMVGWLRVARNPQRRRCRVGAAPAGSVNVRTGKRALPEGYSASTINLTLAAMRGFYEFHAHFGEGPAVNPVPESHRQRLLNRHHAPDAPWQVSRRSRLRQKTVEQSPRSIPDMQWDEMFASLRCDRDRALLACYVSSGARATELLRVLGADVDWAGQRLWVISKGSTARRAVPISPEAVRWLARYIAARGPLDLQEVVWRTRRGESRPLSYSAMRRVVQRANEVLSTNWTLHDMRHTAAIRMANDQALSLTDVQTILGHRDIRTTTRYTVPRVEEMFDRLQTFYTRPRNEPRLPAGYDPQDMEVVFGG